MAGVQPTQELPPWLSLSSITTVDASGSPTTEATIVMLPLTYFGPSVRKSLIAFDLVNRSVI